MALYETERPKSKLELYKEKLKERELYSNNFLDRFTENGAGAPLRNNDGTIMTKRRTMLNNNYEDIYQNQRNATPNPLSLNNNNDNTLNNNTQFYNQQTNNNLNNTIGYQRQNNLMNNYGFNDDTNNYQNSNLYQTLNNNTNNLNNNYNNYNDQNENSQPDFSSSFHRRPQSQILNNNTYINNNINSQNNDIDEYNDPFGNNYKGTGIIPRDRNSIIEDRKNQNKLLRDTWLQEMEEKKQREAKQKQEQIELDLKDEMRYQKEMEELKEKERQNKLKKKEMEESILNQNNLLIENNKKNYNINNQENLLQNNINNNYDNSQNIFGNEIPNFRTYNPQNNNYRTSNFSNMEINNYSIPNNPQELENNINDQIAKLRDDINSQYVEMSNIFGKLKMDVVEANQLKNEAEKELQHIRQELLKNKMANLAYESKLNQVLEKNAPYNNLHINVKDVDPLFSLRNQQKNIQSSSNMIYATDMINEQNVNRVKQLSALAQAGQNLVGLKAESEFIPINNPNENNDFDFNNNNDPKNNIAISKTGYKNLESDSFPIFNQDNNFEMHSGTETRSEPKILDDYMNKGEYSNMYKQLVDIANINHNMNNENTVRTLNKNFEVDYKDLSRNQKQNLNNVDNTKKDISKIDQLLNELN